MKPNTGPQKDGAQPDSGRIQVRGGARLAGSVVVTGAKNSVLKLMAAALLAPGVHTLRNIPAIADVEIMGELLARLGATFTHDLDSAIVTLNIPNELNHRADYDLVRKMRASINVLGPLVARTGLAEVALPGGDAIGSRGLDFHIKGLEQLGAVISNEHGFVIAAAPNGLVGAEIYLDFPSVGATENLLTASVLAKGVTIIDNAAREPDIVDLGQMLISMGAKIKGLGSPTLTITGVKTLKPVDHTAIPDRIVTGTWAFAAAMTKGDITIVGARPEDLELPLDKLVLAGAVVTTTNNGIRVHMESRPKAVDVVTLPYPGFPTDLQPMVIALNAIAEGSAMVTENVFEGRFMFVNELMRLGADVTTDGHHAFVRGKERLSSAPVAATDIRAGAALVLAALVSDGTTIIEDAFHIDRGYPNFDEQLRSLGANITRV
ncbi:UDP-N-acetylglucosamine 1-carboxyvinyltransferase [Actinomycetes bacterium]|nr:UDP-N-acetylglucosamine 1-carboxyvinyltransferase [Actinomycetes bacterium]